MSASFLMMKSSHQKRLARGLLTCLAMLNCMLPNFGTVAAQEPAQADNEGFVPDGAWAFNREKMISRRVIQIVPKAEPQPALSVRLLPALVDQKEGNAAVQYMQAMAFAEQTSARRAKEDFEREQIAIAREEGKDFGEVPPGIWREMAPDELPIDEVKEFLNLTNFQKRFLREAVFRKTCNFDRHIRDVDRPIMFLLPEIQAIRGLARTQALRFRLAIAESDTEEAVAILGQLYGMTNHLSSEPFLVSNLVGIACAGIAWNDSFFLCEHVDAPNLYWAYAMLPKPLMRMDESLSFERDLLFESFERLREVDLSPKADAFWDQCVEDLVGLINDFQIEDSADLVGNTKQSVSVAISACYPGAMKFLVSECGFRLEELELLPKRQIAFLAIRKHYEKSRDDTFKIFYVPFHMRETESLNANRKMEEDQRKYGIITGLSAQLLPAVNAAGTAQARLRQNLAMSQTVESIRDYMAHHEGALPVSLDDLRLPAPMDPVTNAPWTYEVNGGEAILMGAKVGIRYQLILKPQQ